MNNTSQLQTTTGRSGSARNDTESTLLPPVDIVEDAGGITLYADLPGVTRDGLEVRVESGHLFIQGTISVSVPEDLKVLYAEVRGSKFQRSFALSSELDTSHVEANLKDGVLTLKVPRTEAAKPRRIEVKVA